MKIIISRRPPPQMAWIDADGSYAGGRLSAGAPPKNANTIYEPPTEPRPGLQPEHLPEEGRIPSSSDSDGGDVEAPHAEE